MPPQQGDGQAAMTGASVGHYRFKEMIGMGFSPSAADAMLEMERGFNAGAILPTQKRTPENSTRTTLEEFTQTVFAPAFSAAA